MIIIFFFNTFILGYFLIYFDLKLKFSSYANSNSNPYLFKVNIFKNLIILYTYQRSRISNNKSSLGKTLKIGTFILTEKNISESIMSY